MAPHYLGTVLQGQAEHYLERLHEKVEKRLADYLAAGGVGGAGAAATTPGSAKAPGAGGDEAAAGGSSSKAAAAPDWNTYRWGRRSWVHPSALCRPMMPPETLPWSLWLLRVRCLAGSS